MKLSLLSENVDDLIKNADILAKLPREKVQRLLDQGSGGYNWGMNRDRGKFVRLYSWSIPCKEAVDAIIKYAQGPVYDPMAGSGFWAKILNDHGVNVIASDLHTSSKHNDYEHKGRHGKVRRANAYQVAGQTMHRRGGSLILSWPPYGSPVGYNIIKLVPVGTVVFYFGESWGGCTGDDAMFQYFNQNFKELEEVKLPQFDGIRDSLAIWIKETADDLDECEEPECSRRAHPYKDGLCTRHYDLKEYGSCKTCGEPKSAWAEADDEYCYRHENSSTDDLE
jgi:hypothetical protein